LISPAPKQPGSCGTGAPQQPPSEAAAPVLPPINKRAEAATFLLAGLLCCGALIWVLQLWRAELRVPLYYGVGSDLTFQCVLVKGLIHNGWYLNNPRLGAPGVQDLRDFPVPDALHFLSMRIIGWFTSSWGAVVNLYFLASFLAITWSMLAVLRHFGITRGAAVVIALLFSFAPFHFYRNENHLHFSAYYAIPLAGMVLLWIMGDDPLFTTVQRERFVLPVATHKGTAAIIVCVMLGSSGAYYAYLTILLLMIAGLYRQLDQRNLRRAGSAAVLAAVIATTVTLNLLPNILHILVDGKNPEVAVRKPAEAEAYALKLTQLVLPVTGHRIPEWADFKATYNRSPSRSPISEGDGSALGTCFAAGFCFLLLTVVTGNPWSRHRELIRRLGRLNLWAFLICTTGGVGSVLASTISPQIRSYARMGVFIAFFSAFAVAAMLDQIRRHCARAGARSWVFHGVLAGILVAGLLDQTTAADVPPYAQVSKQYHDDAEFAARAERLLPRAAQVLELPFMSFPESPAPRGMAPYDHFRPYLHSAALRWSYGAMKGRYWDAWQGDLSARPVDEVLDAAALAGFGAIYVDRHGYADQGAAIRKSLGGMGLTPIESRDGRFWLYNIGPYARGLQAALTPEEWSRAREAVLHPVLLRWLPLCSGLESKAARDWRWCGGEDGLRVENSSGQPQTLEVHGSLQAAADGPCRIRIDGPGWAEVFPIKDAAPAPLQHSLDVSPGTSVFRLQSDCRRLFAANDPRPLVFRMDNVRAALAHASPTPELIWGGGFYPLEKEGAKAQHWCASSGELTVRNPGPARDTVVRMILASATTSPVPLSITGPTFAESITIEVGGTLFSKRFRVPPGETAIHFSSRAKPVTVGTDPRKVVFRVEDFEFGNPLWEPHLIEVN